MQKFSTFQRFGFQSGKDVNKFEGYDQVKRAENGIYYVTEGTNGYISATVESTMDLGSHTLFIAAVDDMDVLSDVPSTDIQLLPEQYQAKACRTGQ